MHQTLAAMTLLDVEQLDRHALLDHVAEHLQTYSQRTPLNTLNSQSTESLRELLRKARRIAQHRGY